MKTDKLHTEIRNILGIFMSAHFCPSNIHWLELYDELYDSETDERVLAKYNLVIGKLKGQALPFLAGQVFADLQAEVLTDIEEE